MGLVDACSGLLAHILVPYVHVSFLQYEGRDTDADLRAGDQ